MQCEWALRLSLLNISCLINQLINYQGYMIKSIDVQQIIQVTKSETLAKTWLSILRGHCVFSFSHLILQLTVYQMPHMCVFFLYFFSFFFLFFLVIKYLVICEFSRHTRSLLYVLIYIRRRQQTIRMQMTSYIRLLLGCTAIDAIYEFMNVK